MKNKKILHLPIEKSWFDMILEGAKKEEYRQISDHWISRLIDTKTKPVKGEGFKEFDLVKFTNGYRKDSPSFLIECKGIKIDFGNLFWGAKTGQKYFVISLGKIVEDEI